MYDYPATYDNSGSTYNSGTYQDPTVQYDYGQHPYGYGTFGYPPEPKKNYNIVIGVVVAALIMGVAVVLTPILFFNNAKSDSEAMLSDINGDNTQQILDNNLEVTIGDYEDPDSEYSSIGKLPVTLKNKGDERATFYVTIEAVDADGQRLTDTSVSARDLAPGQSYSEDAMIFGRGNDTTDFGSAEFKIAKVTKSNF